MIAWLIHFEHVNIIMINFVIIFLGEIGRTHEGSSERD